LQKRELTLKKEKKKAKQQQQQQQQNCDEPNSLFMTKWCVIRAGLELYLVGLE
jgi:hypothetical protein